MSWVIQKMGSWVKELTSALIQCHFDYAIAIWYSGLSKNLKTKLQIVQNKLIRFILALPARAHVGYEEFSKARMFPVHKRVDQLKMNYMFNFFNVYLQHT